MAGLFQVFRTSAMPKRLLRYALAKFDIFEDDALGLENLDLGFGFKNTFEFKDVGLKVDKLTKQLALPAEYRIRKAKVSRLQITIPLDLYSSSIELIATGIHISLEISSTDSRPKPNSRGKANRVDTSDLVPTAANLAQSFLETQPNQERRAWEEALAAEKQDLGASVTSSEDGGSDEDLATGTGQGLSLPVFLTDFLQGVVDRTRVIIKDVALHLDVEVPVEVKSSETELVSIRLSLDEIHVEGVTTLPQNDGAAKIVPKDGKRHILLSDIRASLITQADVFSSLTRSPSMTSAASRSPLMAQRGLPSEPESLPLPLGELSSSSPANSVGASSPRIADSEDALQIPYDKDNWSGAEDDQEEQPEQPSPLSTPRASVYHEFSGSGEPGHLPPLVAEAPRQLTAANAHVKYSTTGGDTQHHEVALEHSVSSDPASDKSGAHDSEDLCQSQYCANEHLSSGPASDEFGAQDSEDLSQSQYFTHEQAQSMYQSMYMSALSHGDSDQAPGARMPGTWDFHPSPVSSPMVLPMKPHSMTSPASGPGHEGQMVTTHSAEEGHLESMSTTRGQFMAEQIGDRSGLTEVTPKPSLGDLESEAVTRGPARLVKEILSLESISLYIPTKHRHIYVPSSDGATPAKYGIRHVQGSYSTHSPASQSSSRSDHEPQRNDGGNEEGTGDESVEIHLTPVECRFDASIGFLLAMVVKRLLEASNRSLQSSQMADAAANQTASVSIPNCVLSVQKLSILFMEQISGIADNTAKTPKPSLPVDHSLLKAELRNFRATTSQTADSRDARIDLGSFSFGYHDSDIVAFDRSAEVRKSVMINVLEAGSDVSAHLSMNRDTTLLEVQTLPLQVKVDLHRLDETFTWVGGLSGFLQMGASMSSDASQEKPVAKPTKPMGVRFDLPADGDSTRTVHETVTSVRIGGLQLDLLGKVCGLRIVTSAIKFTGNQDDKLRLQISKIQASGPHSKSSSQGPPVMIVMKNTRLHFLDAPRDTDLDRLLALIVPSEGQFEDEADEIMVDTLLRQRRNGSVLDLQVDHVKVLANQLHLLDSIPALGEELARLGAVAKYLPEDDRPGLLTMGLVRDFEASVDIGGRVGVVNAFAQGFEVTHITLPALVACAVQSIKVERNSLEELVGSSSGPDSGLPTQPPVLMVRMIADQIQPVIKVRMRNVNLEYRVPTLMDLMDLSSETTPQEFEAMLAASVANLGDRAHHALVGMEPQRRQSSAASQVKQAKPTVVNVGFRDCIMGLNPLGLTSKLAIVLEDTHVEAGLPVDNSINVVADLKQVTLLLIDDVAVLGASEERPGPSRHRGSYARKQTNMVSTLCSRGYVRICHVWSAKATVQANTAADGEMLVDVELRNKLLLLETCADSTHTLIALAGALKPPTPPSREEKYQTEARRNQDILASVAENYFAPVTTTAYDFDTTFGSAASASQGSVGGDSSDASGELIEVSSLEPGPRHARKQDIAECMFDATASSIMSNSDTSKTSPVTANPGIQVDNNYFVLGPPPTMVGRRWDAHRNKFDEVDAATLRSSPLKVRVRDVEVIWHLFDGYDWEHTREAIAKNVEEVETQAFERHARSRRRSLDEPDSDEEDVIGDCLFNSIYISIPSKNDPRDLVGGINQQLDDDESIAATTVTNTTARTGAGQFRSRSKNLKLGRSRERRIVFELKGINIDLVQFAPPLDQEIAPQMSPAQKGNSPPQSLASVDIRVNSLEIIDNMPTSTWRKFATYDIDAGERELGSDMVHVELGLLKGQSELAAVDHVLRLAVLPLRLHVDQDALDFITRFFQFKDDSQAPAHVSQSDQAHIMRADICMIPVKLDFKPKRVDYAGLRAGRTSEFMNFVTLEGSCLELRHVITHGIEGWENLGNLLNKIWTEEVIRNQLPSVVAGVGPGRHLVTMGEGFRDLVGIPMMEYKKDGRIVRGLGLGATAFAKKTGTEVVKLGAKMAIGTQNMLQNAEGMLTGTSGGEGSPLQTGWEDGGIEGEEKKQISLYAAQPFGVAQGLRSAYSSLLRDLNTTRDALIAVPTEVMESGSARGAAAAVMKRVPTIVFRPMIGVSKAVGQTLMGANNTMDPKQLKRMEDKYKPGR